MDSPWESLLESILARSEIESPLAAQRPSARPVGHSSSIFIVSVVKLAAGTSHGFGDNSNALVS